MDLDPYNELDWKSDHYHAVEGGWPGVSLVGVNYLPRRDNDSLSFDPPQFTATSLELYVGLDVRVEDLVSVRLSRKDRVPATLNTRVPLQLDLRSRSLPETLDFLEDLATSFGRYFDTGDREARRRVRWVLPRMKCLYLGGLDGAYTGKMVDEIMCGRWQTG